MAVKFDRAHEDMTNVVGLEHMNLTVPDQRIATIFYITGMGFTRDPYLVTGVVNMWVNIGRNQYHLPIGKPQKVRGRVGLVTPDLKDLVQSLKSVRKDLAKTKFDFKVKKAHIDVTCPWGNHIRVHEPDPKFGAIVLGMPYVVFDVPKGTAKGIARFYESIFETQATVEKFENATTANVLVGAQQRFLFKESKTKLPPYDGHHIQLYVTNFSRPYQKLLDRGLITQESNQHQYRFLDIVDPKSGKKLYQLEHEIRSMTHPLFGRPMINRNPAQTNNSFAAGYDDRPWAAPV
ncbi:MAG: hypothetical protein ACKVKG_16715 [Alphaproteobacteria bacterium]|jgi:hypothetical protein